MLLVSRLDLPPHAGHRHQPMGARAGLWLCLLIGLLAGGCASSPDYHAAELPVELQAPSVTNSQTLDLSRLAVVTTGTDTIEVGDVLEVTIAANLSLSDTITLPIRVNEQGQAALPVIGPVPVAGLQLEDAEAAIAATSISAGLYKAPQVTVAMKRKRTNRVTVVGAVENPGLYDLPGGQSDLLSALVAAGGLSDEAGTEVEIRNPSHRRTPPPAPLIASTGEAGVRTAAATGREEGGVREAGATGDATRGTTAGAAGGFQIRRINLASLTSGDASLRIGDGAVVMVERRDPQPLDVLGLVRKPGRYEFPPNEEIRVLDAIALAEGSNSAVADRIYVIRKTESGEPVVIEVSLKEAKRSGKDNIRLAPGDVVSVEQTPATIVLDTVRLLNFGVGASLGTIF